MTPSDGEIAPQGERRTVRRQPAQFISNRMQVAGPADHTGSQRAALAGFEPEVRMPPIASTTSGLVAHYLGSTTVITLCLAILAGFLCLGAITIREYAETRRTGLPYKAEHLLAKAEARNRRWYVRAQTRRSKPVTGGEGYCPDAATDLAQVMRLTRDRQSLRTP